VHRLVVVEGEVCVACISEYNCPNGSPIIQEEEKKGGKKGRLMGIITLSDVLRYVIGPVDIGEIAEPKDEIDEEQKAVPESPSKDTLTT
jgi:CBS domain-containing protein